MSAGNGTRKQLESRHRVSDMMVSMHAELRDEYSRRAMALFSVLTLSSIVLTAFVFADPAVLKWLPWGSTASRVTIGVLAITTFFLSLVAARVDWRGKADAHASAARGFVEVKHEAADLLGRFDEATESEINRLFRRYGEIGRLHVPVPENRFPDLKGRHLTKVLVSRFLDKHPASSVRLLSPNPPNDGLGDSP